MIGYHIPFEGFSGSLEYAKALGLPTFQIFIRNNRNLKQREFSQMDIDYFNTHLYPSGINSFVVHAPYVMNPASGNEDLRQKSVRILQSDLLTLQKFFGIKYMVVHPGASTDYTREEALKNLFKSIREVMPYTKGTKLCIETMAGSGTQLMSNYNDLEAFVNEFVGAKDVYLCLDTCHLFGAGLKFNEVIDFLQSKGFNRVGPLHLNGSAHPFGSYKDRHGSLLSGYLPFELNCDSVKLFQEKFPNVPIVLESEESSLHTDWEALRDVGLF